MASPKLLRNALRSGIKPIKIRPDHIDILSSPEEYLANLREGILSAKERITLAALYLGTGTLEQQIVKDLEEAASNNKNLKINILLDGCRASRGKINSLTMLHPLLSPFNRGQVEVSLFQMPQLLGYGSLLPSPLNEAVSVMHLKSYAFDDRTLMTGANLSEIYFTNRQDRYFSFISSELSQFYHNLIHLMGQFSHKLQADGSLEKPKLIEFPEEFKANMKEALSSICNLGNHDDQTNNVACYEKGTWVLPTIQMGFLGIRNDEEVTKALFEWGLANKQSSLYISTAYLNFTEAYSRLLSQRLGKTKILTAGPISHGYAGATGFKAWIPKAYISLENEVYEACVMKHKSQMSSLLQYDRPGWTFHAKGVWIDMGNFNHSVPENQSKEHTPGISVVGSSNFGYRSTERDLESQLVLVTDSPEMKRKLCREWNFLANDSFCKEKLSKMYSSSRKATLTDLLTNKILSFTTPVYKSFL